MVLYIIGLGMGDEKDVTVRGKEIIEQSDVVYLESYTSIMNCSKEKLEQFYKKNITEVDRLFAEENCDIILDASKEKMVSFLVVGDPLGATTHHDIILRAKQKNIQVEIIHNSSIITAVAECGMQLYNFGMVVSIPFFENDYKPTSYYDKIKTNMDNNLHTLCLLDIKVKERTIENIMKNKHIFEPPKFMTVNQAIEQLFYCEEIFGKNICTANTLAFAIIRLGFSDQKIISGNLAKLKLLNYENPVHSLVLCAPVLHDVEQQFFNLYLCKD